MFIIEEIDSVSGEEFDSLFTHSLPYMEAGTYEWSFVGNPETLEEKLEAVRLRFEELIDLPKSKCVLWRKDGVPISIAAGNINAFDEDYITWITVLYGPDDSGSRSWLYDENFIQVTKDYFMQNWGVLGYKASCINNGGIMNYHLNKPNAQKYYEVSIDSVRDVQGVELAMLKFTYK